MDLSSGAATVFAVLLPESQFEFSWPTMAGLFVVCAAAWIAMVIDIRRRPIQRAERSAAAIQVSRTPHIEAHEFGRIGGGPR